MATRITQRGKHGGASTSVTWNNVERERCKSPSLPRIPIDSGFSVSISVLFGAQLVTDDSTKIAILKAAFPKARISVSQQKPLDWTLGRWPGTN
jgi:hypothetical protein